MTILDPACGSGNFLYVALNLLLDLEKEVIAYAAQHGITLFPSVRPTQLLGIEINAYAQELASVVIWIGYLQWMHDNGFTPPPTPSSNRSKPSAAWTRSSTSPTPRTRANPNGPRPNSSSAIRRFSGDKQMRATLATSTQSSFVDSV